MKQKNNKKIIIIIVIIVILLIVLAIFSFFKYNSKNKEVKNTNFYDYDNTNKIKICKTKEIDCKRPMYDTYDLIKIEYDYKVLNKELERINKETLKLYEESKKSDINDSTCDNVRNKYNYRLSNRIHFENYENNNIISISIHRIQTDLCTDETHSLSYEALTYHKESKKLLTQEEIREVEQISDEDIALTIKNATEYISKEDNKEYEIQTNYDDVIIYYGKEYNMMIAFKLPGEELYIDSILERA